MPIKLPTGELASEWQCVTFVLYSARRYVDAYVSDMVALNRDEADGGWLLALERDETALPRYLAEWRNVGAIAVGELRSKIFVSAALTAGTAAVSLVAAFHLGALAPSLPVSWPKALLCSGACLMAWATILGLGTPRSTWDGPALHDRLVPKLFLLPFLPGLLATLLGTLL